MAFASTGDVAARLGRDLTSAETETATLILEVVEGLIRDEVGKPSDWEPDPVPATLRLICIEKAISAIANPTSVASRSEQLGSYQHSETFPRSRDAGPYLSDIEGRLAREAVYGATSGASDPEGFIDRVIEQTLGS